MGGIGGSGGDMLPEGVAVLNAFAAACLDAAERELNDTGALRSAVNFGYDLRGSAGEAAISLFAFTRQGTDEEEKEIQEITNYARATSAEAVSVVMDLANDPDALALFSGSDGILLVAAVSLEGTLGIMRPYRKSDGQIIFGEPRITDSFSMPILEGIFVSSL